MLPEIYSQIFDFFGTCFSYFVSKICPSKIWLNKFFLFKMTESNSHAQRFRPLEDQKDQKKPNINVACNYAPLEDQQKTQIEFLQGIKHYYYMS